MRLAGCVLAGGGGKFATLEGRGRRRSRRSFGGRRRLATWRRIVADEGGTGGKVEDPGRSLRLGEGDLRSAESASRLQ